MLPGAILWGASFPLALAAVAARGQDPARLVGGVYAANTVGAIVGALVTSLLLVGTVGIYAAFTTRSAPAEEGAEGAAAQDPSSPGFMNRMEDRWRRRSEGE